MNGLWPPFSHTHGLSHLLIISIQHTCLLSGPSPPHHKDPAAAAATSLWPHFWFSAMLSRLFSASLSSITSRASFSNLHLESQPQPLMFFPSCKSNAHSVCPTLPLRLNHSAPNLLPLESCFWVQPRPLTNTPITSALELKKASCYQREQKSCLSSGWHIAKITVY